MKFFLLIKDKEGKQTWITSDDGVKIQEVAVHLVKSGKAENAILLNDSDGLQYTYELKLSVETRKIENNHEQ